MMNERNPLLPQRAAQESKFNRVIDKVFVSMGAINDLLLLCGMFLAGYIPPPAPTKTVEEINEHYRRHERGIQISGTFFVLSGITYPLFASAVSKQLSRIPNINSSLVTAFNMASVTVMTVVVIPGLFMCLAGYRLDRSPEITSMLHDIIIIYIVVPFSPLAVQGWIFALAVFQDYADDDDDEDGCSRCRLFPKWVGWFSVVAPVIMIPGVAAHFVYTGPIAWNGVFAFWIPAITFFIQVNVMGWATFFAIDKKVVE